MDTQKQSVVTEPKVAGAPLKNFTIPLPVEAIEKIKQHAEADRRPDAQFARNLVLDGLERIEANGEAAGK